LWRDERVHLQGLGHLKLDKVERASKAGDMGGAGEGWGGGGGGDAQLHLRAAESVPKLLGTTGLRPCGEKGSAATKQFL